MSAPHQVLASPASRLCVPLDEWPEHDRRRWLEAQQPAVRRRSIHDPVPADRGRRRHNPKDRWPARRSQQRRTSLSPQRLRDLERAYGLWLRYLADHGGFDAAAGPAGAVTDDHVDGFVSWLQAGGKPATVH